MYSDHCSQWTWSAAVEDCISSLPLKQQILEFDGVKEKGYPGRYFFLVLQLLDSFREKEATSTVKPQHLLPYPKLAGCQASEADQIQSHLTACSDLMLKNAVFLSMFYLLPISWATLWECSLKQKDIQLCSTLLHRDEYCLIFYLFIEVRAFGKQPLLSPKCCLRAYGDTNSKIVSFLNDAGASCTSLLSLCFLFFKFYSSTLDGALEIIPSDSQSPAV